MKRAKFLEGSNGKLSATQLVFILVIFLGSCIDEIQGASQLPTVSGTTSGTPSMSLSMSGSFSTSITTSISGTTSLSFSASIPVSGTATITVTTGLTPTATAAPTLTATVGTSPSGTVSTGLTPTATAAPSATASLSVGASPSSSSGPLLLAGQTLRAYEQYFCGNSVKEKQFGEHCDFGRANVPKFTCCTPSCHWANGGRRCAQRFNGCYRIGRCTGYSSCRGSFPKNFGAGCNKRKGFCDGAGNCVEKSQYWFYYLKARAAGTIVKKKYLKKYLQQHRKKYKNFDLADIKSAPGHRFYAPNNTFLYDPDLDEGHLEALEKIIEEESHITKLDYDPLDEPEEQDPKQELVPLSED